MVAYKDACVHEWAQRKREREREKKRIMLTVAGFCGVLEVFTDSFGDFRTLLLTLMIETSHLRGPGNAIFSTASSTEICNRPASVQ